MHFLDKGWGIENFQIKGEGIEILVFKIIKGGSDRRISYILCYIMQ